MFLDVMISILSFRKIKGNLVCYHVVPWLQELLNLIDIQNADSEEHFKLFFDSLSGTVIEAKVRNHVSFLRITRGCKPLCCCTYILSN